MKSSNKLPWWYPFSPMTQNKEVSYSLPYLMAAKLFTEGKANEDHIAEIAGHLRIATYLDVEPELIDEAKRIIFRIIRQWKNNPSYTEEEADIVHAAILEYARIISNSPIFLIQEAIKKVIGEPKKKKKKK